MKKILIIIAIVLVVGGSIPTIIFLLPGTKTFTESKPLALIITEVRSFYHAEDIMTRLDEMGLKPYIVAIDDSMEGGKWYKILIGAEKDPALIDKLRRELEEKYCFKNLVLTDYTKIKGTIIKFNKKKIGETKVIDTAKPSIQNAVYDVMAKFPNTNMFFVKKLVVWDCPSDGNGEIIGEPDLPRGIKGENVLIEGNIFCEAIYEDNICGDQVTLDILKLRPLEERIQIYKIINKKKIPFDSTYSVSEKFADMILASGKYITEQKTSYFVDTNGVYLTGFKVLIEPKSGYQRTYLILTDEKQEYLYITQSTGKTDIELKQILCLIGKGNGMVDYREFHNLFFCLPNKLIDEDYFVSLELKKVGWDYAQAKGNALWAKKIVGHWSVKSAYYCPAKGDYYYLIFDLLTPDKADYIYNTLYTKDKEEEQKLVINGNRGFYIELYYFSEVNFSNSRYVFATNGKTEEDWYDSYYGRKSLIFTKEDLMKRAELLQLPMNVYVEK